MASQSNNMASRPQPNTYYFYGFVSVDLNLTRTDNSTLLTCPISDPDIAGIGVVTSFLIAGLMTTFASITAAILECRIDDKIGTIFLPGFLHRRLARNQTIESVERCRFWRNILQRLILNLADQQLITGFSLLVIGYIVQPWPLSEKGHSWPSRLSLVIYLSCLSSSSHLACMLTLNRYLEGHSRLAKLRIFFIILFAIILSISIGLGQTFSVVGYVLSLILGSVHSTTAYKTSRYIGNGLLYGLPPLIALHVYWTGVLQLIPTTQENIKKSTSRFYHSYGRKLVPGRALKTVFGPRSEKLRSTIKAVLWWFLFLNPPMIFASQIFFAMISIALILLQKFAGPHPDSLCYDCDYWYACKGLNNQEENKWGFGQMLAMFVLVLPVLAAVETYTGKTALFPRRSQTRFNC